MNQDGDTALMRAVRINDVGMVTLLLDRGASVDLANKVHALPERIMLWRTCLRGEERKGLRRDEGVEELQGWGGTGVGSGQA